MKIFVGITDFDWFSSLSLLNNPEEVNFWQPSGKTQFRSLNPGELFLFKLHNPNNFIVGGGFFAHSSILPISLAWETFGILNGVNSLIEMRKRVEKYRRQPENRSDDYRIGCILLEMPFFFQRKAWFPVPSDWKPSIVQGKGYEFSSLHGRELWDQVQNVVSTQPNNNRVKEETPRYGLPLMVKPRLGQGSFRILVTDAYDRRCAITNERTLPALEAAHIRPFSESGEHIVSNGILLRRDLHSLFDKGYITITPSMNIEISQKIKEEFENGRDYYRFHGSQIRVPEVPENRPSRDFLQWHNQNIFR